MSASPPTQVVIGLDVGTTATKVVAFGLDAPWRASAAREYPLLEPQPGWQVQQPEAVRTAMVDALREVVAACGGAEVVALSLSTAWHALVGLDDAGEPLTPIVTWADARASQTLVDLGGRAEMAWLHQLSGTPVHPMAPVLKLRWFADHEPPLARSVRWWLGLKDFVIHALSGEIATELSTASGSGLLNRWTQEWNPQAAAVAQVDPECLPPIRSTSSVVRLQASVASQVGLPAGTPIVLGAADGPLGNVGTGAVEPGVAGMSLGTSGAVRLLVDEQPAHLDPSLFCYSLDERTWTVGGAVSNGGLIVRWLADTLLDPGQEPPDEAVLALAARAEPGCEGLVMLPYVLAERAPLWDPLIPGAYLGLRRRHGRAHLARAAIEGVALHLALIADRLDRVQPITAVRATGGAFRAPLWGQVIAACLARPLTVTSTGAGTALGAAAFGLRALGIEPTLASAARRLHLPDEAADHVVEPDPAWVTAYASARASIPELIEAIGPVARAFGAQA